MMSTAPSWFDLLPQLVADEFAKIVASAQTPRWTDLLIVALPFFIAWTNDRLKQAYDPNRDALVKRLDFAVDFSGSALGTSIVLVVQSLTLDPRVLNFNMLWILVVLMTALTVHRLLALIVSDFARQRKDEKGATTSADRLMVTMTVIVAALALVMALAFGARVSAECGSV